MVDPNPARGMPIQLQRYWLVGKGAAKIRWNIPGDFKRCVHHLIKYFPKDPEGLCNILHTKATGGPPGHGSLEKPLHHHSVGLEEATALLAAMPMLGSRLWAGPLAPIGRPTGEPRRQRVFEHGALTNRPLPLPLAHRRVTAEGHQGAVTVGRILGLTYGPDHEGNDYAWGWGDWFDPAIVPEVKEAQYLVDQGVAGPSVDPGGKVMAALNPETGAEHMTMYTIGGATLVAIPAFAALHLLSFDADGDWPDDDPDMPGDYAGSGDCGCNHKYGLDVGETEQTFTVNPDGWRGLPLATRNAPFDNDDAVKRISAWSGVNAQGADVGKLRRAFLWRDPQLPETDPTSYRLPVGDIINGRLTLVFHAIYAAAALLSGAHGGLPGVSDEDRAQLRNVISEIYPEMATAFNDSSIRAPWDRSGQEGVQMAMEFQTDMKEPYGDVKYADPGYQQDGKKRYPIDNEEHVRAAWSYINQADNAGQYSADQLKRIKARIKAAAKKYGISISDTASVEFASIADSQYPLTPPLEWFGNPNLTSKTPLTVDVDGRVYGHLAAWGECHRDVSMRECVLAPKSAQEYAPFHLGYVMTEEGDMLKVGKIVMDTRHAPINMGYSAAALHYDNTGDEVAVVRAGEDQFGIWVAGAVVPEATPKKVAKLRRSPLSGDWRRIMGNLELCAALAVNVPAFPVYAMEDEDRTALTAAGTVFTEDEEPDIEEQTTLDAFFQALGAEEKDTRAQRLLDLEEDEWIYTQRERAERLMNLYAMDPSAAPVTPVAPVAPAAPAPVAPVAGQPAPAPQPGAVPDAPTDVADPLNLTDDEMLAMQMSARFSLLPEGGGQTEAPANTGGQAEAPAAGASTTPAQAPAQQTTVPVG
jgi:uncharacterized protein DUF6582